MIHIDLPWPVVLAHTLKEAPALLGEPAGELEKLARYAAYEGPGPDGGTAYYDEAEARGLPGDARGKLLMGSLGILDIAGRKGVQVPHICSVDIPQAVFYEEPDAWMGICALCARTERRADRAAMLERIHAPELLLRNEMRLLEDAVRAIDSAPPGGQGAGGEQPPSLRGIGWAMELGEWLPWKLKQMEERDAALEKEAHIEALAAERGGI